jgi:hypothetical protein
MHLGKEKIESRLQEICDALSPEKIDALLRKWLRRLPHPFTAADRKAGYRYAISILQAEFSLTQVLDRPVHGRMFFEEVIRENLAGRIHYASVLFTRTDYKAQVPVRIGNQDFTIRLRRADDNPTLVELARFLKSFKRTS